MEVKLSTRKTNCMCWPRARPASQGERDPAQAAGAAVVEVARHAAQLPARDQLLLRIGAAKKDAGRAFRLRQDQIPKADEAVTRADFHVSGRQGQAESGEQRDGHYLLRTNLAPNPAVLWNRYVQLTQIEAASKSLKSELGVRPIYHRLEHRVDAHILVAFLAYCLQSR